MGPLFVLVTWAMLAAVAGTVTGLVGYLVSGRQTPALRWKRTVFAALLPGLAIGWAAFSVVCFAVWCNATGMHRGFGNFADFSEVPLPNGYSIWMIDTTEHGSIHRGGVPVPLIAGVTEVAEERSLVFGRTPQGFFALDTAAGDLKQRLTEVEYRQDVGRRGLAAPALVPVGRFYTGRRWNALDSAIVALQVLAPLALLTLVWRKFLREPGAMPGAPIPP